MNQKWVWKSLSIFRALLDFSYSVWLLCLCVCVYVYVSLWNIEKWQTKHSFMSAAILVFGILDGFFCFHLFFFYIRFEVLNILNGPKYAMAILEYREAFHFYSILTHLPFALFCYYCCSRCFVFLTFCSRLIHAKVI